jgi:hypothetical protein
LTNFGPSSGSTDVCVDFGIHLNQSPIISVISIEGSTKFVIFNNIYAFAFVSSFDSLGRDVSTSWFGLSHGLKFNYLGVRREWLFFHALIPLLFFHGRRLLFHQTEFSRFGQFSSRV